jgi:hypothetical protein
MNLFSQKSESDLIATFTKGPLFMTTGLLISRKTKNTLFKLQLADNNPENVNIYKAFKQLYFKIVRAAKKLYFQRKFQENTGNSKKTWDTLNEALGKEKRINLLMK